MTRLPDLDPLTDPEKDALILALWAQVQEIEGLKRRIAELAAKLDAPPKTSDNSSVPPSTGRKPNKPARDARRGKRRRNTETLKIKIKDLRADQIMTTLAVEANSTQYQPGSARTVQAPKRPSDQTDSRGFMARSRQFVNISDGGVPARGQAAE